MDELQDFKVFTDEEKKALVNLIEAKAEAKAKEMLDEKGVTSDLLSGTDEEIFYRKDAKRVDSIRKIWANNGWVENTRQKVTLSNLIQKDIEITDKARAEFKQKGLSRPETAYSKDMFSTDHPLLIPRVVSNMARDAIEPNLVLTPLLQTITYEAGTSITFPSWGSMSAAHVAEGEEYPERGLDLAGQVTATIGKHGLAIKVSEEVMRYSLFDVLSAHIRAAGRALARHKEVQVADMITTGGTTLMDNSSALYKSTTGRDAGGTYNGTLTLDDLMYAFAAMVDTGFTPNALIMHPFAWQIFSQEGIARAFGFINGMNPLMWQMPQGNPGNAPQWRVGGLNQNTYTSSPANIATTFTNVPSIFPTNFRIIISPFMPYTASTSLTDVALVDANEMGVLVVDEQVTTEQWNDPARDILKMKFRERYAVAAINNGLGIGLLKNIKIAKSFDFADRISANIDLTGLGNLLTGDATNYSTTV